jgi:hypothetical protein
MWFIEMGFAAVVGFTLLMGAGMLGMLELGRRAAVRARSEDSEGAKEALGAVEGSIFALLGLLVAFTFAGAAQRYDSRRELVVQEANAIGDAWARLDTLPPETQPALRDGFRQYVDSRLKTYRLLPDVDAALAEVRRSVVIQDDIWAKAVAACRTPDGQRVTMLVLPALDAMFDMTLLRTAAAMHHPPAIIFFLLFALALTASFIAGHKMVGKRRNWGHMVGFAAVTTIAVYVILDLEAPRAGLVRVDAVDQLLIDVRTSMK